MCGAVSKQTAISFSQGLEMIRCSNCDTQTWTLNGTVVEMAVAKGLLATSFTEQRAQRDLTAMRAKQAQTRANTAAGIPNPKAKIKHDTTPKTVRDRERFLAALASALEADGSGKFDLTALAKTG